MNSEKKNEDKLQSQCFKWAWNNHPETRGLLFHVPNGGKRNKLEAIKFKAMGVVAGVPDLLLVWSGHTHYIELKTSSGVLSELQKKIHDKFLSQGVKVHVAWSFEEFKIILLEILGKQP